MYRVYSSNTEIVIVGESPVLHLGLHLHFAYCQTFIQSFIEPNHLHDMHVNFNQLGTTINAVCRYIMRMLVTHLDTVILSE